MLNITSIPGLAMFKHAKGRYFLRISFQSMSLTIAGMDVIVIKPIVKRE
jgi:hypothetical protein